MIAEVGPHSPTADLTPAGSLLPAGFSFALASCLANRGYPPTSTSLHRYSWSRHHSLSGGVAISGEAGTCFDSERDRASTLVVPGGRRVTDLRRYLIQYNPVPGIPMEMYGCPLGDRPYRSPGTPTLQPTPPLESVTLNGPRPKTLRQRQPMNGLSTACRRTDSPRARPSCRRRSPCAGPSDRAPLT